MANYSFNHKMLTLAREVRGLNQKELSERVNGLTQGNLSRIERGLLKASDNVVEQLSKVLSFPISFFKQTELKSTLNEIYYRKRSTALKKQIKDFEARRDLVVKMVDLLMSGLEMPDLRIPIINLEDGFSPVTVARKIRNYLKLPKGPVGDIIRIIEKEGIIVHIIDAPNKIDGCTMITDSGIPIIFVNANHPPDKQRFTIVHELGHIVMHLYFLVPDTRDTEMETNVFTGEFYMPEMDCLIDLKGLTFSHLSNLKSYWGCSYATIIRRAFDIGLISKSKRQSLYIQRSQLGYIKREPLCNVKIGEPKLLKHICNFYINKLGYTKSELIKSLHLYQEDFEELILNKKSKSHLRIIKSSEKKKGQINLGNL